MRCDYTLVTNLLTSRHTTRRASNTNTNTPTTPPMMVKGISATATELPMNNKKKSTPEIDGPL